MAARCCGRSADGAARSAAPLARPASGRSRDGAGVGWQRSRLSLERRRRANGASALGRSWRRFDRPALRADGLDGHRRRRRRLLCGAAAGSGFASGCRRRQQPSPRRATGRSGRSSRTRALLALPPRSDAGDLIVRERTVIWLRTGTSICRRRVDHLIDGDPEFARQIVNEKLAQNTTSLIPAAQSAGICVATG